MRHSHVHDPPVKRPVRRSDLAKRNAAFRDELGLTQNDFAAMLGINQRSLSALETGRTEPSLAHIDALISADSSLWLFESIGPLRTVSPSAVRNRRPSRWSAGRWVWPLWYDPYRYGERGRVTNKTGIMPYFAELVYPSTITI